MTASPATTGTSSVTRCGPAGVAADRVAAPLQLRGQAPADVAADPGDEHMQRPAFALGFEHDHKPTK